jgi:hypothetical protein
MPTLGSGNDHKLRKHSIGIFVLCVQHFSVSQSSVRSSNMKSTWVEGTFAQKKDFLDKKDYFFVA